MLPKPFNRLPADAMPVLTLSPGDHLFVQEDPTRGLFYLSEGRLLLERTTQDGQPVTLFTARAPTSLAEASLFSDGYHCSARALAASTITLIPKRLILQKIASDPAFATELIALLSRQIQFYRRQTEILAINSAQERVLAGLHSFGQPGTVTDFAATLGLSHEATFRALSTLVRAGQVKRIGRGKYQACNPQITEG